MARRLRVYSIYSFYGMNFSDIWNAIINNTSNSGILLLNFPSVLLKIYSVWNLHYIYLQFVRMSLHAILCISLFLLYVYVQLYYSHKIIHSNVCVILNIYILNKKALKINDKKCLNTVFIVLHSWSYFARN